MNLSKLALISSMVLSTSIISGTASASEYYNCANATGCQLVSSKSAKSDDTATQYPVVMAHGMFGWTKVLKILDYWFGIPEALMEGGADVYTTKTSSINDSEFRGEQLLRQVQTITAITGKDKVNLFGHSHGGHDIRYVAAVAPELVASATAVASPEQGSKMADWSIKMIKEGSAKDGYSEGEYNIPSKVVFAFFEFVGSSLDLGAGITLKDLQDQDTFASLTALSTDYMTNYFNPKYPDAMPSEYCGQPPAEYTVNGVSYYSFSGVGTVYNILDPSDYLMAATSKSFGDNDPNDGLVSACSSRLGHVIRDDYPMNHLDSVNHVLGMVAWGQVEPTAIYRTQVNRLKLAGY